MVRAAPRVCNGPAAAQKWGFRGICGPVAKRSLGLTAKVVGETFAICAPTVLDAAIGRLTRKACDDRIASWSKKVVAHARMHVTVRGRDEWDPTRAFVIMSNHQSHMDIPLLFSIFGGEVRMVAKIELFRVPVFGPAIRLAGFVAVDRSDHERALASLGDARSALDAGTSIWIAPEGTRSATGELGPFKKGGFYLALDAGAPILPVSIQGTRHVLPAHGVMAARDVPVRVVLHPPVDPRPYGAAGDRRAAADALMADVRAAIESGL